MTYLFSVLGCILAGVVGALLSLKSNAGGSALWAFFGGQVALIVWAWMTKQPMKPWAAAVLFDGVYNGSWLVTLLVRGEEPLPRQILGGVLVLVGIVLASDG